MQKKRLSDGELYEAHFEFKSRKNSFLFLSVFLGILLLLGGLLTFFFTNYMGVVVNGSSMKHTLQHGDKLFVKRVEVGEADYGDIIVVDIGKYLNEAEKEGVKDGLIIKRLIAKEGDRVYCSAGIVKVWYQGDDGWTTLEEDYAYYGISDFNKENYSFEE